MELGECVGRHDVQPDVGDGAVPHDPRSTKRTIRRPQVRRQSSEQQHAHNVMAFRTMKRPIHQSQQAADDSRGVKRWFTHIAPVRLR